MHLHTLKRRIHIKAIIASDVFPSQRMRSEHSSNPDAARVVIYHMQHEKF